MYWIYVGKYLTFHFQPPLSMTNNRKQRLEAPSLLRFLISNSLTRLQTLHLETACQNSAWIAMPSARMHGWMCPLVNIHLMHSLHVRSLCHLLFIPQCCYFTIMWLICMSLSPPMWKTLGMALVLPIYVTASYNWRT